MKRLTGALATAALLTLLPAGIAQAQEEPDTTVSACGGEVSVFVVSENIQAKEQSFGFRFTGNVVLRLADEDSSIVVRTPGRLLIEEENGLRTSTSSGQNLFAPVTPGELAATREFFGTDLVLVQGRIVSSERIRPDGSVIEGSQQVASASGRITDLCEALVSR